MHSTVFYNISTVGYLIGLSLFFIHVVNTRKLWLKAGILIVAMSFLLQTCGMVARWIEAGFLEISAAEKAIGQSLYGWSWFVVFTQHPPWSNLYEIMVYMSWGIVMTTLAVELKWQLIWVRHIGLILALMALGMASLTDATIKPLVPALKSWWIMIHVISASIAYACGFIAAFVCLFSLMKDRQRIKAHRFIGFALIFIGILLFALGGGLRLFLHQAYFVKLLAYAGENIVHVLDMAKDKGVAYLVPMPLVGWFLMSAIILHLSLGIVIAFIHLKYHLIAYLLWGCFFSTMLCLGLMLFHDATSTSITTFSDNTHHLAPIGPWFIGLKSHPWSLGLLIFTTLIEALLLFYWLRPGVIIDKLPVLPALEQASYRIISLSFFLMTLVLITGALWAHYAWGRYWAWDPKETGALAIWLNYAIFLHTRRTAGLSGPFSSVIGVLGFFVIVVGFLGVNLGLFADGLHSYGSN